jgi:hypothetical protein
MLSIVSSIYTKSLYTVYILIVLFVSLKQLPIISGDTIAVLNNAQALGECLNSSIWRNCPNTNQFGAIQTFPAILLIRKGFDSNSLLILFSLINYASLILFLLYILYKFRNDNFVRNVFLITFFYSSIIAYSAYTFAEGLQFVIFALLPIMMYSNQKFLSFLFALLTSATRETATIIILPIILAMFIRSRNSTQNFDRYSSRSIYFAFFGILVGNVVQYALNFWKFGTWKNLSQLDPSYITPSFNVFFSNFLGLIFSPNGGVFFFSFFFVFLLFILISKFYNLESSGERSILLLHLLSLLIALSGLSMWFAPFGWVAWGPRLMIPNIGLIASSLILIYRRQILAYLLIFLSKRYSKFFLSVCVSLSVLPSIGFLINPDILNFVFSTDSFCPEIPIIQNGTEYYYRCLIHLTWKVENSMLLLGFFNLNNTFGLFCIIITFLTSWRLFRQIQNCSP